MRKYIIELEGDLVLVDSSVELVKTISNYSDKLIKVHVVNKANHNTIIDQFCGRLSEFDYIESYFDLNLD